MDCSPLDSSNHEILQARILEWVAIPFSRWYSWPRDQTRISYVTCIIYQEDSLLLSHMGSPMLSSLSLNVWDIPKHWCICSFLCPLSPLYDGDALFFYLFFFYWRIIALQNFVVFCQTSTWVSHRYTCNLSLLNLPPISHPIPPL